MNLAVWSDPEGTPIGFQLCCDRGRGESALTWWRHTGLTHMIVDDGQSNPMDPKRAPVLASPTDNDRAGILDRFLTLAGEVPTPVVHLVRAVLTDPPAPGEWPRGVEVLPPLPAPGSPPAVPTPTMPAVPASLTDAFQDRFRLDFELGQVGMGTVYLAWDPVLERRVALKVLRPDIAAIASAPFLWEMRVAARFSHPHLVPVYDSGDAYGYLYYVMPYSWHQSVRDRLTGEQYLPIPDAVQILRDVVTALGRLHQHGVVHRGITPDHVVLRERHAMLMVGMVGEVRSGRLVLGSPPYLAPELATGPPHDHRVDIYAVGALGYELLTGSPPFQGTTDEILHGHAWVEPVPVQVCRPSVPDALDRVIMRCLAKAPAERWQTAEELRLQFEVLLTPPADP
jgi:hypothetical protein